ncbi:MAG TPA: PQQ-binding-like beta-propeller repeat protein [Gemmataceae bacterium]|jgi:hypothetical protein|nr:PQQ-binding-like beta-propeller repeat protein [Gemmataceae bacterium]
MAHGALPDLNKLRWQRQLLFDKEGDVEDPRGEEAKSWVDKGLAKATDDPIVPGFFPLIINNLVVYRSYYDVRAVYFRDAKDKMGIVVAKAGSIAWKSTDFDGALANLLADSKSKPTLDSWLTRYYSNAGFRSLVYENTFNGTLSSDRRNVYAIDDLSVPAPVDQLQPYTWSSGSISHEVKPLVLQNTLFAINSLYGKLAWRLGGSVGDPFANSHFLGVPIAVGDKLYVLNEKNSGPTGDSELRLLCLDPFKLASLPAGPAVPTVLKPIMSLGTVRQQERVTHDARRRLNAAHLAYGEGVLVCPTHAGTVFGVDPANQRLLWTYSYREMAPQPDPKKLQWPVPLPVTHWKACAPVLHDGKVVFTAPDDASLHCLNLASGKLLWKAPPQGDIYVAGVFNDKVLLVGKAGCRALGLADGKQLWALATGIPSGMGAGNNETFFLPLKKGAESGLPEVCAIDLVQGKIAGRVETRDGNFPGNLLFQNDNVFSQTATGLTAYPRKEK